MRGPGDLDVSKNGGKKKSESGASISLYGLNELFKFCQEKGALPNIKLKPYCQSVCASETPKLAFMSPTSLKLQQKDWRRGKSFPEASITLEPMDNFEECRQASKPRCFVSLNLSSISQDRNSERMTAGIAESMCLEILHELVIRLVRPWST